MLDRLRLLHWSARKVIQPIYIKELILDVGSGGNPHPFADVLLEKYLDDTHRLRGISLDRPAVLADAAKMPFKTNAFGYSFAFHVLEHLHQPAEFLSELERVSKAGYIETPNALYERIHPFDVHLLEILEIDGVLHIYKKNGPYGDDFIGRLDLLEKDESWRRFFCRHPRFFHTCYKWDGKIHFKIHNPDVSTKWFDDPDTLINQPSTELEEVAEASLRERIIHLIRSFRKRTFDLDAILACPECHSGLKREAESYLCTSPECGLRFVNNGVADFNNPI